MAYRVIRMNLTVANLMLATGTLCSPPENVPPDLRVVDARVRESAGVGVIELLCFSGTFIPHRDHPVRAVMCGKASDEDWSAPRFVLEATHAGCRVTPCFP